MPHYFTILGKSISAEACVTYKTNAFPRWIGLSSVLCPCQHSIDYMGDGFYRSKDPTDSIKVLKKQIIYRQIKHTIRRHEHKTQQVP